MPTVRLPDALRRYAGGSVVLVVAGTTVGETLENLLARHPDLRVRLVDEAGLIRSHLAVFRNDGQLRRDEVARTPVAPEDTITLLEAVGGGAG